MFPNVIPPKPVEDALSPTNLDAVADALAAQYKASQQAADLPDYRSDDGFRTLAHGDNPSA